MSERPAGQLDVWDVLAEARPVPELNRAGLSPTLHVVRRPAEDSLAAIAVANLLNEVNAQRAAEGLPPRKPTVLDQARAAKKAADAVTVVACLAAAGLEAGDFSQQNYRRYWEMKERTAQKDWAGFREAVPGEESPERVARKMALMFGNRITKARTAEAGLAAPGDLLTV